MALTGSRTEAFTSHSFSFEIGQIQHAAFTEFSGLQAEVDTFPYEEGGVNDYVHRLPGRTKVSENVVLKRGVAYSDELWRWFRDVTTGRFKRSNASVVLYDAAFREVKRWHIIEAYPVKWVGPAFKAGENAVSIETLELAHKGVVLG